MSGDDAPRIEDYALVGSTHSAALIHRDGTVAWLCLPRFDSDAFFASLLGTPDNGSWRVGAADPANARVSRRYRPDTMVLETTIETGAGRATVIDFMPLPAVGGTHELVRIVRGDAGSVDMVVALKLRFGYGRWTPWTQHVGGMRVAMSGPDAVRISTPANLDDVHVTDAAPFTVHQGQGIALVLEWFPSHTVPPLPRDAYALLRQTETMSRAWAERYADADDPHQATVRRSLLTLKAMTYSPSGGIVAAPTTSLPETLGGERNWDYRYCWLRDAVLTLHALTESGFDEDARSWREWLLRAAGGAPGDLQIMYGLQGERRLTEFELPHLSGFAGSRPVRIGNAASDQRQLDVYGSVLAAFEGSRRRGLPGMDEARPLERAIADALATLWKEPDSSLWESRGAPRHYVHSKVMCWLAFDRLVAGAREFELDGPVDEWERLRDAIHADVCAHGFNAGMNSFTRSYGSSDVDAALLQLPMLGFLPTDDPRIQGTIARIERDLLKNGVVYRYVNAQEDENQGDGLRGDEGAFLACSFWLCDAYALSGRVADAEAMFEKLLAYGNDLGLFAEEVDPVARRQLGNFPQAFSHLALINTALTLKRVKRGETSYLAHRSHG